VIDFYFDYFNNLEQLWFDYNNDRITVEAVGILIDIRLKVEYRMVDAPLFGGEPVPMVTNVENGFGIFAGLASNRKRIER
jgi:hypothetical protein